MQTTFNQLLGLTVWMTMAGDLTQTGPSAVTPIAVDPVVKMLADLDLVNLPALRRAIEDWSKD